MVRPRWSTTVAPVSSGASADGPPMIAALTGIRGFAALACVLYHFRDVLFALMPSTYSMEQFLQYGYLGVDVFFVLSGFVISYNYADRMRTLDWTRCRSFFVARFARIYPVHLVTLLIAVALIGGLAIAGGDLNPGQGRTLPGLVANFFLLQAVPGIAPWNPASWSISSEAAAYLVFPLLAPLLSRLGWRTALVLAAGAALLQLVAIEAIPEWFPFFGVRIAGEFTLGCLLWALWRGRMRASRWWDVVALASLAAALTCVWTDRMWYAVPFLALMVASTSTSTSVVRTVLSSPLMQWAGRVSYSLYLSYVPVIIVMWMVLPPTRFGFESHVVRIGVVAAYLIAMFVVAAALYYGVEEPAREWIRRRADGRRLPQRRAGDGAPETASDVVEPSPAPATRVP